MATITTSDSYLRLSITETANNASYVTYLLKLEKNSNDTLKNITGKFRLGGNVTNVSVANVGSAIGTVVAQKSLTLNYESSSETVTTAFFDSSYTIVTEEDETSGSSYLWDTYTSYRPVYTSMTTSANSVTAGSSITITTSQGSSGNMTFSIGGTVVETKTSVGNTTTTWTPAIATYANAIRNASSASCTITWNGITKNVTVNIPNNSTTQPIISSVAVVPVDGLGGLYVQGKSKAKVTVTASAYQNASISSYSITIDGTAYMANPATSGVLSSSGSKTVSVTVTDSRGFSKTTSTTFTVTAYTPPTFSNVSIYRSNSSGTASSTGTYLTYKFTATITALGNNNAKNFGLQYKRNTNSSWTNAQSSTTLDSYSSTKTVTVNANLSSTYLYDARVWIADSYDTVYTSDSSIASESVIMDFNSAGTGGGVGMYTQAAGYFDLGWIARFQKGIGSMTATDLNNLALNGFYLYVAGATNAPTTTSGGLVLQTCYSSTYMHQLAFINAAATDTNTTRIYHRRKNGSGWTAWKAVPYDDGGGSSQEGSTPTALSAEVTKSCTTTYSYSGLSFSIPAGKGFNVRCWTYYDAVSPGGIILSESSSSISGGNVRMEAISSSMPNAPRVTLDFVGMNTTSSSKTYYLWGKTASSSGSIGFEYEGYYI